MLDGPEDVEPLHHQGDRRVVRHFPGMEAHHALGVVHHIHARERQRARRGPRDGDGEGSAHRHVRQRGGCAPPQPDLRHQRVGPQRVQGGGLLVRQARSASTGIKAAFLPEHDEGGHGRDAGGLGTGDRGQGEEACGEGDRRHRHAARSPGPRGLVVTFHRDVHKPGSGEVGGCVRIGNAPWAASIPTAMAESGQPLFAFTAHWLMPSSFPVGSMPTCS